MCGGFFLRKELKIMYDKLYSAIELLFSANFVHVELFTNIIIMSLFAALLYAFTFPFKGIRQGRIIFWLYIVIVIGYVSSYFGIFVPIV